MIRLVIFFVLSCISLKVFCVEDLYPFENPIQKSRFETLTSQLRCLVCQNQNLSESNAPLAMDLRDQIYEKIIKGEDNQTIIDYLVERYGDFVLYRPPVNVVTLSLWFGPVLLLMGSILYLIYYIRKSKSC